MNITIKKKCSIWFLFFVILIPSQETIEQNLYKKKDTLALNKEKQTNNDTIKNWSIVGQNSFLFNQASYSQWIGGGNNNLGWLVGTNYSLIYMNNKNLWENNILLSYGQNKIQGLGNRKTQDVINLSTNYGHKVLDHWYASAGVSFITQFTIGYDGGNDPTKSRISNLMAPGYLNVGLGMTYKKNTNFSLNIRPANIRMTFVLDESLQRKGTYGLQNDGDWSLFQFGFLSSVMYDFEIMERVNLVNNAFFYSNYLNHPERLVLSYSGLLNMKINKLLSANISLDLMYDHNQIQKTQLKQTVGIGFLYKLDNGVKLKKDHFPINVYKKNYSEFFQKRN